MIRKLGLKTSPSSYVYAICVSIMTYYLCNTLGHYASVELERRNPTRLKLIPSAKLEITNKNVSLEVMIKIVRLRGGSLVNLLIPCLNIVTDWICSYIMRMLPTKVLNIIAALKNNLVFKIILSILLGTQTIISFKELALLSNNTLFNIDLPSIYPTIDLNAALDKLPPCDNAPEGVFENFIMFQTTDTELDQSLDKLLNFLTDSNNSKDFVSVLVCLSTILIILYKSYRGRYDVLINKLWRAYKEGKLTRSQYMVLLKLLRRKGILVPKI